MNSPIWYPPPERRQYLAQRIRGEWQKFNSIPVTPHNVQLMCQRIGAIAAEVPWVQQYMAYLESQAVYEYEEEVIYEEEVREVIYEEY